MQSQDALPRFHEKETFEKIIYIYIYINYKVIT